MAANPFASAALSMTSTGPGVTGRPFENVQNHYDIGNILGTGAFSTVREGTSRTTREKVALKIISGNKFKRDERTTRILRNEINIMEQITQQLHHPSLMRLLGVFEEQPRLVLVMEHLSGGELFDRIVQRGHYSEKDAAELFAKLMGAMAALHSRGVLHRDMKPENCIYASPAEDAEIKITDFGLAAMSQEFGGFGDVHNSLVGTPGYVAPEVLQSRTYTPACDVWSMGVILYILLCGYPPFWADSNNELFEIIKRGEYEFHEDSWGTISDTAKDLVRRCLTLDHTRRITAAGVLDHPWIRELASNSNVHMPNAIQRLVAFNAKRKFKAAAMAAILSTKGFNIRAALKDTMGTASFSPEELETLKASFRLAAGGENGFITQEKFVETMTDLGYDHMPLDNMYRIFDRDGDNHVDYREFLMGLGMMKKKGEATTKFCFDIYDEDGSGYISREELAKVLFTIASDQEKEELLESGRLQAIFDQIDTNHDNQISFEEFKNGIQGVPMLVKQFLVVREASSRRLLNINAGGGHDADEDSHSPVPPREAAAAAAADVPPPAPAAAPAAAAAAAPPAASPPAAPSAAGPAPAVAGTKTEKKKGRCAIV